jgi:glycosyltransferase involved in cell wall biosynthesis
MVPSILGMTSALNSQGKDVVVVTRTPSDLRTTPLDHSLRIYGPEVDLANVVQSASVLHIHGLWQSQTRHGAHLALRAHVPYLIAAHGMVDSWALRHKRWKKALYLALVESAKLRCAACLHALSHPEIDHLHKLAPRVPICRVPNGIVLEPFQNLPSRSVLQRHHPELEGKFVLLFFGRLHIKKGLDLLADAMSRVSAYFPDLHLLVAGRDDGAWQPFVQRMAKYSLLDRVTYLGHVGLNDARMVWGAADAFALPSYSEGFSMAILEALACSLPCLITTTCYFPELAIAQGAVVVPPSVEGVTQGLHDLLTRTPEERQLLASKGRSLVERDYTWSKQALRLTSVYNWLVGGGQRPDCVIP